MSDDVTRYPLTTWSDGRHEDTDGEYVPHDDYAALAALAARLRAAEALAGRWITAALQSAGTLGVAFDPTHPEGWMHAQTAYVLQEIERRKVAEAENARLRMSPEEVTALRAFFTYGATRGNHGEYDPSLPGDLTPHVQAMSAFVARVEGAARASEARDA